MTLITVYKHNDRGDYVFHYAGEVVERGDDWVCLQARFGRADVDVGYVVFRRGDLMTEWFYSDRWYNIFRIDDVDDGRLKGWYCNITRPALLDADRIINEDLALDVFVTPAGDILLDDEDEFDALALSPAEREASLAAVEELRRLVAERLPPFDAITPGRDE
jgi:hypothetical protein